MSRVMNLEKSEVRFGETPKPTREVRTGKLLTNAACAPRRRTAADTAVTTETTREGLSFHAVECFLEDLLIGCATEFLAGAVDPFFLERVFGGTIGFVEDAKDAGEWELRQFVSGELVGDVVTEFVLGG